MRQGFIEAVQTVQHVAGGNIQPRQVAALAQLRKNLLGAAGRSEGLLPTPQIHQRLQGAVQRAPDLQFLAQPFINGQGGLVALAGASHLRRNSRRYALARGSRWRASNRHQCGRPAKPRRAPGDRPAPGRCAPAGWSLRRGGLRSLDSSDSRAASRIWRRRRGCGSALRSATSLSSAGDCPPSAIKSLFPPEAV